MSAKLARSACLVWQAVLWGACGAPRPPPPPAAATYAVGGTVSGLQGTLVLANQNIDLQVVDRNGPFLFSRGLAANEGYAIDVVAQPARQICAVGAGRSRGVIAAGPVLDVAVRCETLRLRLGGRIAGLVGPAVLTNNGADPLVVAANGPFVMPTAVPSGASYALAAAAIGHSCEVTAGSGVFNALDVDDVLVACRADAFPLGGSLSGLVAGAQLTLAAGGATTVLTANGPFALAAPQPFASAYRVDIVAQPAAQSCTLAGGAGQMPAGPVADIAVACNLLPATAVARHLGGTLAGASGPVRLDDGLGNSVVLPGNGPFTLPQTYLETQPFSVAVGSAPAHQSCTVAPAAGIFAAADITTLAVSCVGAPTQLSGQVVGLAAGKSLALTLAGGPPTTVAASGAFTLAQALPFGTPYEVAIAAQPVAMDCAVGGAVGVAGDAAAPALTVTCRPFLRLTSAHPAALAVGQQDTASQAFAIASPQSLGSPSSVWAQPGGPLWVADPLFRRVTGSLALPGSSGVAADFVLNQADLQSTQASVGPGAGASDTPASVAADGSRLVVADPGYHRVLIWDGAPTARLAASRAVGQTSLAGASPACTASGLNRPAGVALGGGALAVADTGNNRVLVWRTAPASSGQAADLVLGQVDFVHCGGGQGASGLSAPQGVWTDGTQLAVADTGNNRVLLWPDITAASAGAAAQLAVGQPTLSSSAMGSDLGRSLAAPQAVFSAFGQLFVSDTGRHRVMIFNSWPSAPNAAADVALGAGDPGMVAGCNWGYYPSVASFTLCQPGGLMVQGERLWVADTGNGRALAYQSD